jgi:hypothetical protein
VGQSVRGPIVATAITPRCGGCPGLC